MLLQLQGKVLVMNLTPQQMQSLDRGNAIPVTVEGRECVVVRREIYEQFNAMEDDEEGVAGDAALLGRFGAGGLGRSL